MAEARASCPGGFEDAFVCEVDEELQCPICQLPMKEPLQTKCGHRFCFRCLEEHCKRSECQYCPLDRTDIEDDVFPDKATERKILSLHIKCPSPSCPWTGELRSKDNHLVSCPLVTIPCPYAQLGCTEKIQRGKVESHLQSTVRSHLDSACVKLAALENKKSQTYTWKITGFNKVLRQAKRGEITTIESFPFSLGRDYGYCFKLYLYPNGKGSGYNTHLSIEIVIVKGEYDAILPWPFETGLVITLIDQQEDPNERKNVSDYFQNPCVERPLTQDESRDEMIFEEFISHKKLNKRRYIENDTLFVIVIIDIDHDTMWPISPESGAGSGSNSDSES